MYIHAIALPLIGAGISILAVPGFRDFALHYLDNTFSTRLNFTSSEATGWSLIGLGLLVYIVERVSDAFGGQPLLALRHQSFLPLPPTLARRDLPRRFATKRVRPIDCDLYAVMGADSRNLEAALNVHNDWAYKVVGAITGAPDAPVAYYGIVHIPFQFLAGCKFSNYRKIELFELERNTDRWLQLEHRTKVPLLSVKVHREGFDQPTPDVAIRISISYLIRWQEIASVLPAPCADVHLRIEQPQIDAVRTWQDVRNISSAFRTEIDSPQVRGKRIHVFFSGPVSLGFSLGQQISPTIHGEVHVYNYNASKSPPYEWSILMTHEPKGEHVRRF